MTDSAELTLALTPQGRGWTTAGLCITLVTVCVIHWVWPIGPTGEASYLAITIGSAIAGWIALSRQPREGRFPWACVILGVTLSGIGDAFFSLVHWLDGVPPDLSIADIFYLASYVAISCGLLTLLVGGTSLRRLDIDGLIDMASFAVLSIVVVVQILDVGDIFADTSSPFVARVTWAAYPVLDAMLLAVLVRSMFAGRLRGLSGVLMFVGISAWLASDFATLLIADPEFLSKWLDLGWMLGAASMAACARQIRSAVVTPDSPRGGGAGVLISLAPLVIPGAVDTWAHLQNRNPNPVPLFFATITFILLASIRWARLVRAGDQHAADLDHSRRYYLALAENSADAMVVLDEHGLIVNDAPQLAAMLGRPDVGAGSDAIELMDSRDRSRIRIAFDRMRATSGEVAETELRARHSDGSLRWLSLRVVNLSHDAAVAGLVVNVHDVTDRKRAEGELTHRAFHDPLTNLANRALFHERLHQTLSRTDRPADDSAVVYLDVDGFKTINDSRGHEAGDSVLREIATRLEGSVRDGDLVARLGGDEFAILIANSEQALEDSSTVASRVLKSLTEPVHFDDQKLILSASIGITISDPQSTASSMLRDADVAMYRAKATGKAKWIVYDPEMRSAAIERLQLEADLSNALSSDEFFLLYQPIIELGSGQVTGFEALLRWRHPLRRIVTPNTFIPIAESNGSIIPIGEWVLREACAAASAFHAFAPDRHLSMAVNLSTRQIAIPSITDHVTKALQQSGYPADQLVLEMTESVLVEDPTTAAARLCSLRALGVRLAIDDFGTGYSSLSYLSQFPVNILKIDRSFINAITRGERMPPIVRGLLDLGNTLGLETIAEGIEDRFQHDTLIEQNCRFGQGFLYAKPLTVPDAMALLAQPSSAHPAVAGSL